MKAHQILTAGLQVLEQRGRDRDQPGGERSIPAVVEAFNALTGHQLTAQQGWIFMALVKMRRSQSGAPDADHYVDGSNYFALAGEEALSEPGYRLTPVGEAALAKSFYPQTYPCSGCGDPWIRPGLCGVCADTAGRLEREHAAGRAP